MAFAIVQTSPAEASNFWINVGTTFATAPTVGNGLIVCVSFTNGTPGTITVSDNATGNTWHLAQTTNSGASGTPYAFVYYCASVVGTRAGFRVTFATSGFGNQSAAAVEVSGVGAGLSVSATAIGSGGATGSGIAVATAALVALGSHDVVLAAQLSATPVSGATYAVATASPVWVPVYEEGRPAFGSGEGDTRVLTAGVGATPHGEWTASVALNAWAGVVVAFGGPVAPPEPPSIPAGTQFKLLIDGVDRTDWLANGYAIDIEKVLSQESMHLSILDLDSTASAYRPSVGQTIRFTRIDDSESELDIELLFGGIIMQVTDEPIIDDTGTVTRLRCRDWMYLADQVFLPTRIFDSTTAGEMFSTIVDTYLGPKGVTINTIPTGGGVIVPELRIEDPVTTIREALDRLTIASGYPWRMAEPTVLETPGEVWAAMVVPGTFDGPATLADDGNSVLTDPPLRWEKELLTHATRVWVQTSTSETNSGPVEFTESWTADGATAVYPVHVIPSEIRASTTAAAESFATTLALDGMPPNAMIRVGGLLAIDWHTQLYTVGATVTTDAEGKATITTLEAMERDVPEGHSVVFKPSAFVQLEINGVVTPMDGVPYVWEDHEHAIVYPGVAWTAGTTILYRTWGYHPFYVREWDPSAQLAVGWFDYGALVDQFVTDEEGHTDLTAARAFAQAELARRLEPAKRVTCTTRIPGHYPLLTVPMNFPDRLVTGDYLITETRIRHSTIDETSDEQPLFYELVLMEGDALGESWIQYFRGRNPSQGIKWGPVHDAALVSQVALEVMMAVGPLVDVSQVAVEVMEQSAAQAATVSQVAIEVMIA